MRIKLGYEVMMIDDLIEFRLDCKSLFSRYAIKVNKKNQENKDY